ncbi:MAG TPA: tetratricopeptide repeat protein [Candidatus Krumholzibacteria bacterium]|nr:tetratricopeptide repeat protein [Candidatus Krumholzibacteria bacterium]
MQEFTAPTLSWRRKLGFSLVLVVLVLGTLELGLRLTGVQPVEESDDPFVGFAGSAPLFEAATDDAGNPVLVTAPSKRGYFNAQSFPATKAPNTTRVFCLGGSTTYGRPYDDATSFAGWMRHLLTEADPDRAFEIVNAGGISYASYRVARLTDELLRYEPDLLVVYTGHNEFLEERTYADVRDRSPLFRVALDAVNSTRIGALARQVLGSDRGAVDGRTVLPAEVQARLDHSAGLDLYERDDELDAGVTRHYERALRSIVAKARAASVDVVLVTPASNMAGFSPFKSQPSPGLDAPRQEEVETALTTAREALETGNTDSAVDAAARAVALDPRSADAHWVHGQALRAAGRAEEAEAAYRTARDEDVCTLRAPSRFVEIVRAVADDTGTPAVDYVRLLRDEAVRRDETPLVGDQFFLDHVHPTIEGHRLLATRLVETFAEQGWIEPSTGYGPETVARIAERVESSVSEETHARALANLALTLSWAGKAEDSRRLADRALESGVEDGTILLMAARHATLEGDHDAARGYYQRAVAAAPNDPVTRSQMGFFLAGIGQHEAAVAQFYLASLLWNDNETYHQQLGFALERIGRHDLALAAFERARALAPQDPKLQRKVATLSERIPPNARFTDLEPQVTRHPSGYPESLMTTRVVANGPRVPDGFRVEWYETGELRSFTQLRAGHGKGASVRWDRQGLEIERSPAAGAD